MKKDDLVSKTNLILTYSRSGLLSNALQVFFQISFRDLVLWNAVIGVYAEHGCLEESINCIERMQEESISPDAVSFISCLKACSSCRAIDKGCEIHCSITQNGLLEKDLLIGTMLVDMYAKHGWLAEAKQVFDKLLVQNVISFTCLLAGYIEHGWDHNALKLFEQMEQEGISPNNVTYMCILKSYKNLGSMDKIRRIHADIVKKGLLEEDIRNSLIDAYSRCGYITEAQKLFEELLTCNASSWNALIA